MKYLIIKTTKYTSDGEEKQEIVFSSDWGHEAVNVCMAFNRHARCNVTYQLFVLYEGQPT